MEKQDAVTLVHSMHPDFFEREYIRSILEDWIFEEMLLPLENFDPGRYEKSFDSSVTFSYFQGNRDELLKIVEQVNSDWPAFFGGDDRVLCGYLNGKVVSFCIVEDMGTHMVNGQALKIGGPGCVGTLPEYRDKGIGLTMVKKATQILRTRVMTTAISIIPMWCNGMRSLVTKPF